jgi:hypothetical protein
MRQGEDKTTIRNDHLCQPSLGGFTIALSMTFDCSPIGSWRNLVVTAIRLQRVFPLLFCGVLVVDAL